MSCRDRDTAQKGIFLKQKESCTKCGIFNRRINHDKVCLARNATCFKCRRRGHFARVCFAKIHITGNGGPKENDTTVKKTKSTSRRRRDEQRMREFKVRKQVCALFPFSDIPDNKMPRKSTGNSHGVKYMKNLLDINSKLMCENEILKVQHAKLQQDIATKTEENEELRKSVDSTEKFLDVIMLQNQKEKRTYEEQMSQALAKLRAEIERLSESYQATNQQQHFKIDQLETELKSYRPPVNPVYNYQVYNEPPQVNNMGPTYNCADNYQGNRTGGRRKHNGQHPRARRSQNYF